jgi:hypothetical protein
MPVPSGDVNRMMKTNVLMNCFVFIAQELTGTHGGSLDRLYPPQGTTVFTITPEHGPAPYMPLAPYSRHPLGNQWENNLYIVERLKAIIR